MATTDIVPASSIEALPTERLESEITSLAAHISAATARWLTLVAELDRRMAWADWDCKSCAHWLSWRCGLGIRAAQEHVRVARSLVDLPHTRAAFERGRLSFSQARALTRVATPDNDAELVQLAISAPAAQLEGMVRAFRGAVRAHETRDSARRNVTRHLTYYFDEDGSFVINGRLSPEEGAVVKEALDRLSGQLEEQGRSAERLEAEIADDMMDELGEKAFQPSDDMSARAQNERDEARILFFNGQMSHDYSRRRADALVALAQKSFDEVAARSSETADRYQVVVHVDAEALLDDSSDGRSELSDGPTLPPETVRRLTCDCSIVEMLERDTEILSVGRKTRKIPRPIRRALKARDGHCRFPGCTNKVWVDAHHIRHWTKGGETKLANLCLLCRAHHRAVHEYGYNVRAIDGVLVFYRPDGSVIENPAPPESHPDAIVALNDEHGLDMGPETPVPDWYGEKWDYDVTVASLMNDHGIDPWSNEEGAIDSS